MDFNRLPTELLGHVCDYVDSTSLQSFSLVNKVCRPVTVPALFEIISIEPQEALQLQQALKPGGYLEPKHIRTLEIRSGLSRTIRDLQETFPDPKFLADFFPDGYQQVEDPSWRQVLELLEDLPVVTDLIWACKQQFPPCLLRHIEQMLPSCRFYLRDFWLRSLVKGVAETVDPYELKLVQSPNLHSIWFSYNIAHTWNNKYKMPETVSRTVQGLAPNLSQVCLWQEMMGAEPDYSEYAHLIRTLESATSTLSYGKGRLESLCFTGHSQYLTAEMVDQWVRCTDFGVMKKLVFDCRIGLAALVQLAGCRFSSLVVLDLKLAVEDSTDSYTRAHPEESSKPAQEFLCSIPSLKTLKLSGEMEYSRLREVILHHGRTLRTLCIQPMGYSSARLSFPPVEVSWIAGHCLVLEDLRLTMHRSKGDKSETAAYSAIGKIRTLQSLTLTLDASDYTSLRIEGEESEDYLADAKAGFDEFGRENTGMGETFHGSSDPRKGHILDMFVNAALDERLACSIHAKIIDARPCRAFALNTVELQSDGCGNFGTASVPTAVARVANEIQHRWLFQLKYRFSTTGVLEVHELPHKHLLRTSNHYILGITRNGVADETAAKDNKLDCKIEPIFRRLWPAQPEDSHWYSDWHSFGLCD